MLGSTAAGDPPVTTAADEPSASPRAGNNFWAGLRETVVVVVLALLVATGIRVLLVQAFVIPSSSMEDTLLIGDRVLVDKVGARLNDPAPGDVVVFTDPGGWLPPFVDTRPDGVRGAIRAAFEFVGVLPSSAEGHLIKRVIAVGGDRVRCCNEDGQLLVNGVPVEEQGILKPGVEPSATPFRARVPADSVWVMGDNRSNSGDSRVHGPVPQSAVVGRAFVLVWPPERWSRIERPDAYAAAAAANDAALDTASRDRSDGRVRGAGP